VLGVNWEDLVLVGRVARPHGLKGDVVVNPETDFVKERFAEGATLWTRSDRGDEQLVIRSARLHGSRPVLGFEGIERIDDAERLAGLELRVPEDSLQPLADGTYYQHQLVGCLVETTSGMQVGEVARVEGGAAGSLLAIDGPSGEILIPLAVDICTMVDVTGKRITIDPPEGLLDLNDRSDRTGTTRTTRTTRTIRTIRTTRTTRATEK
jgi:16S rRNA processing protein RimM